MKERCGRQNGMKLTSHASVCNTAMVGFESEDTLERESPSTLVLHRVLWAWSQPYFNRIMRYHTWHALSTGFFVNHQIELLPWPARSPDLSPIENMWSMVAQRLTQITPPAATTDQLWQRVEAT
ncbi:transposable element Tcb1 transposase [Trichonephila clavipes]|nr:transposable element Tcb1 transposase [Trichonephila clavipes]